MKIEKSWGLCVLTTIALVMGVHELRAQYYPNPGSAPAMAGYPGPAPTAGPGMAAGSAPGSMPNMASHNGNGWGAPGYSPMAGPPNGPAAGPMMPPGGMGRDMRIPAGGGAMPPMGAAGFQPGPMRPPGMAYGPQPAGYYDRAQAPPPQELSPSPAVPMGDPGAHGYPMMGGAPSQYFGGYDPAMGASDDFDLTVLRYLLPYGAGGCGTPRWYDAAAEWVFLKRDSVGDDTVFATSGIDGVPVLGTTQLDFDYESGFRTSFAIQLGPGSALETTYLGLANWASEESVFSEDNDLYSIYSEFGTDPPPFGFDETDRASLQRIAYSSDFDTIELNYRRRWAGPNTRLQGSYLCGIRYMQLKEDFEYETASPLNQASQTTLVSTLNSLTGAQLGADLWLCIMPGLNIGTEAKVGLYGNHAAQRTTISTLARPTPHEEYVTEDSPAFLGDANATILWRINQQWTFRAGYMFLWMDEVALATDNFNPETPIFGGVTPRAASIDNSSYVFYHGGTAGFEYLW